MDSRVQPYAMGAREQAGETIARMRMKAAQSKEMRLAEKDGSEKTPSAGCSPAQSKTAR